MKFRRKPVTRDVVDALKGADDYVVQRDDGTLTNVPHADFERDYEPAKRDYAKRARKQRVPKKGAES